MEYQLPALGSLETGPKLVPKCRGGWGNSGIGLMGYGPGDRGAKGRGNRPARANVPTTDDEQNRHTSAPKQELWTDPLNPMIIKDGNVGTIHAGIYNQQHDYQLEMISVICKKCFSVELL